MDSFNKVISFALGLVVVLVFFAVVTGKINLKSKTSTTAAKTSITPTPTQKNSGGFFGFFKSSTPPNPNTKSASYNTEGTDDNNVYKQNTTTSSAKSIPSTGLPTLFIPILISGLAGGSLLRKAGKK
jgi:hypothetical protein